MTEQMTERELSDMMRLKKLAAQMEEAEYLGLSEEEIQEKKRQKEMRRQKNVQILEDTLEILEKGCYTADAREVCLHFTPGQMWEVRVFLPDEIAALRTEAQGLGALDGGRCLFGCENTDALALAQRKYQNLRRSGTSNPEILVLNLASATQPGGRTRQGASAQEEDLCRRSSLLLSLESEGAKRYYDYNNARKTRMGSDAVILSPYVEVIKDSSAELLPDPFRISVISCAAPMVRLSFEGMSRQEYEMMLYQRIQGMLLVAASHGYRHLILGAFGCGVYGNDAATVSDLFYRAIQNLSYAGIGSARLFDSVDFAVLCRSDKDYNYVEFCRN
ncbi:MAG: TIGR02452 family protein, partial [Lachnospiraceae bacterium]|nr:TIGR02452 family protein [Lachnospiraceae bacterium]